MVLVYKPSQGVQQVIVQVIHLGGFLEALSLCSDKERTDEKLRTTREEAKLEGKGEKRKV